MRIQGHEYRFIHIPDPPFQYGFGMDDPDYEYWIVPAYKDQDARVYRRPHLPVRDGEPEEPWQDISGTTPELVTLGRFLGSLNLGCPHELGRYYVIPGRWPDDFMVEASCTEMGCEHQTPHDRDSFVCCGGEEWWVDWSKKELKDD